jgi:hypothetical protein
MPAGRDQVAGTDDRYKWVALANTTAAMFMATLDKTASSVNATG